MSENIKKLIVRNELEAALEVLFEATKDNRKLNNEVIVLFSRFTDFKNKQSLNLLPLSETEPMLRQLILSILEVTNDLAIKNNTTCGGKEGVLL